MAIGFDSIPLVINTPGVFAEFDPTRAVKGVQLGPHDALIVGQKHPSAGSATANTVYSVESEAEAIALFGRNSQVANMVKAFKAVDDATPLYAIGTADGTTAATGSIVWTGTATEAGELVFYVGGRRVSVAVANGDTAATVETNALAAFALETDMPVTVAANAASGVDFTAIQKGTIGNQIQIGLCLLPGERVPAGLTPTVNAMASGATDPTYASAITAMGEDQYHTIAVGCCTATVLGLFVTELESRWGPMRAIEGVAFAALYDTRANLTTFGNALNSQTLVVHGAEKSAALPLPWELAAQDAALSAKQTQTDPSRALTNLSYAGYSAPARGTRYTRAERDILLSDGISTSLAGSDGRLLVERFVTTWQTYQSIANAAYKDLTTVRLLAAIRYTLRARISSKFARFKLTDNGNPIPAGQPIVNPDIVRSEVIVLFQDWQALGWVENLDQFVEELIVERDISDPNRLNMIVPPDLINNLLVTAAKVSFLR